MVFNSVNFAIFLPLVFILYWYVTKGNLKFQNIILLFASLFFYASWDYRFLLLLLFSISLDYVTGIKIFESQNKIAKKIWFLISIITNVGLLAIFKYYNFFIESFSEALLLLNIKTNPVTLNLILPVGISFYTFHGLSYIIDIYKGRILAEKNFINYSVFVSFFPLLVAGPIERATHLLPQIQKNRKFNYSIAVSGIRQILWGAFKKIAIADFLAVYVEEGFRKHITLSGMEIATSVIYFSIQIYCDFSGYSDIAKGAAKLFGIELLDNFRFPYFSKNISEFWRRWHISLSSWFRDYIYIPLGGSKTSNLIAIRNVFIVFVLSGFWHGAKWTYIFWGFYHAVLFFPMFLRKEQKNDIEMVKNTFLIFPSLKNICKILLTYFLVNIGWIFFRSESMSQAISVIKSIALNNFLPTNFHFYNLFGLFVIVYLFVFEWINKEKRFGLDIGLYPKYIRRCIYLTTVFLIYLMYSPQANSTFIYFQF